MTPPSTVVRHRGETMHRKVLIVVLVTVVLASCGEQGTPPPPPPVIPGEVVSVPVTPLGQNTALAGDTLTYRSGGATSSLGHPVEFRFDLDRVGSGNLTAWGDADSVTVIWAGAGPVDVAAQARCKIHPTIESEWSGALTVTLGLVADTEITLITNTYFVGGQPVQEIVNFVDAIPDTVPYGSWITIFYSGSGYSPALCPDSVNQCFKYQIRYDRDSRFFPGGQKFFPSSWLPFDPTDNDPLTAADSTSMNIGSVEYVVSARTTNLTGPDPTPPSFSIVGNFDPTLDSLSLENHDGTVINANDTIVWDWSAPADSGFAIVGGNLMKTKRFYFLVQAAGHDHPKEAGSGVAAWRYTFPRVSDGFEEPFGNAGFWLDGLPNSTLSDTASYVAVYPFADVQGDAIFNNLPSWHDQTHVYTVTGRDLPGLESFDQFVFFLGSKQLINSYCTSDMARRTATNTLRFHIRLQR